jgi:hypothetical protein
LSRASHAKRRGGSLFRTEKFTYLFRLVQFSFLLLFLNFVVDLFILFFNTPPIILGVQNSPKSPLSSYPAITIGNIEDYEVKTIVSPVPLEFIASAGSQ